MKRLIALVIIILFMTGCSKQFWDEFSDGARLGNQGWAELQAQQQQNQPTYCTCHTYGNTTSCRCD